LEICGLEIFVLKTAQKSSRTSRPSRSSVRPARRCPRRRRRRGTDGRCRRARHDPTSRVGDGIVVRLRHGVVHRGPERRRVDQLEIV